MNYALGLGLGLGLDFGLSDGVLPNWTYNDSMIRGFRSAQALIISSSTKIASSP